MLAVNNGAVNISRSPVTNTGSSSTVNWEELLHLLFSNGGIVSNALASTVNGIYTRSGSVDIASCLCNCEWRFYTSLVDLLVLPLVCIKITC
jgi:hypothetical protein